MADREVRRRLAAILVADVAGYTRLLEDDTDGTVAAWQDAREDVIKPCVADHSGQIVKLTGDGFLVEFPTVQDAVNCAINMQTGLGASSLDFRMGINLGDIVDDGEDIHGEGVNVAARLEGLAEPGGICISGLVYESIRNRIDAEFEDMGPQDVKNVSGPVQAYAVRTVEPATAAAEHGGGGQLSIAVLPFDNLSGDTDQEYFSDGLTEDIITALSHWHSFSVIARNSTFQYKGQSPDIRQVAAHLGVQYVLEGSVRKAGERVRITAQLIDGATGNHVWADKFDRQLDDFFELQDELTQIIAAKVEPEFAKAEQKRVARKSLGSLDGWDCYQRAIASLNELTEDGNLRAQELFRRAIEIDPKDSRPHAGLAYCLFRYSNDGYSDEKGYANEESLEHARRAVALDDGDAQAHEILAILLAHSHQLDAAITEARRAVDINPNFAHAYVPLGNSLSMAGQPEDGIPYLETAIRLNPDDVRGHIYLELLAESHLNNRDYDQAVVWARKSIERKRDFLHPHIILASALGNRGDTADAAKALADCEQLHPNFIEQFPTLNFYRDPADKDHIVDGLRKAGWKDADSEPALPDKPSIAVLPFDNLSGDPEQDFIGDGLTEDIITALSRMRSFLVIARNSTFQYKGTSPDIRRVAEELDVRYVLEGSVRKSGDRIRVTAQLIDATNNTHLWAERFDREFTDIFSVQDEITGTLVAQLEPELGRAEYERVKSKPPEDLDAWELVQRGNAHLPSKNLESSAEARRLFEQAIERDPGCVAAHAGISLTFISRYFNDSADPDIEGGMLVARQALKLDNNDPHSHYALGLAHFLDRHPDTAISAFEECLRLNPNYAPAHDWMGAMFCHSGRPDEAIPHAEMAIRLSPSDPAIGMFYFHYSLAHLYLKQYEQAVKLGRKALQKGCPWPGNAYLTAALEHLGRTDEAQNACKELIKISPNVTIEFVRERIPTTHQPSLDHLLDGLRNAGLPES